MPGIQCKGYTKVVQAYVHQTLCPGGAASIQGFDNMELGPGARRIGCCAGIFALSAGSGRGGAGGEGEQLAFWHGSDRLI